VTARGASSSLAANAKGSALPSSEVHPLHPLAVCKLVETAPSNATAKSSSVPSAFVCTAAPCALPPRDVQAPHAPPGIVCDAV
jgi:hypothetical protein